MCRALVSSKQEKTPQKVHVSSDRIKNAEQRLQIGNSFETIADLGDDDMDISYDIQQPPAETNIPIFPPDV